MSEMTAETCQNCGHEGKTAKRKVVVCDNCGAQADMVYCPYNRGMVAPRDQGWIGGFWHDMVKSSRGVSDVGSADLCSIACGQAWSKCHERALVIA